MRLIRPILGAVICALHSAGCSPVLKDPPKGDEIAILGAGATLCKDWTANAKAGGAPRAAQNQWLFGVFSGFNMLVDRKKTEFQSYDEPDLLKAVDLYCEAHPDSLPTVPIHQFFRGAL